MYMYYEERRLLYYIIKRFGRYSISENGLHTYIRY